MIGPIFISDDLVELTAIIFFFQIEPISQAGISCNYKVDKYKLPFAYTFVLATRNFFTAVFDKLGHKVVSYYKHFLLSSRYIGKDNTYTTKSISYNFEAQPCIYAT